MTYSCGRSVNFFQKNLDHNAYGRTYVENSSKDKINKTKPAFLIYFHFRELFKPLNVILYILYRLLSSTRMIGLEKLS